MLKRATASAKEIRFSRWKARSRRLPSRRRGRACRRPRRGLPTPRPQLQRPGEIEVLEAALAQAKAMFQQSNTNLERVRSLFDKGWVSKAQFDDAVAQHDRNEAAVKEAERRIEAAKLPGRTDMIEAAAANVQAARQALAETEKSLGKRKVFAPADGTVEEVYFRSGEVVNAGQAVVALP